MSFLHRKRSARARATILSVHDPKVLIDGNQYTDDGRTPLGERIRVRVKPDGQPEFESEARVRHGSTGAADAPPGPDAD